jgi:hypothetical protein
MLTNSFVYPHVAADSFPHAMNNFLRLGSSYIWKTSSVMFNRKIGLRKGLRLGLGWRIRAAGGRQRTGGVDTIHSSFAAAPMFTSLSPFPATLYLASTLIAY